MSDNDPRGPLLNPDEPSASNSGDAIFRHEYISDLVRRPEPQSLQAEEDYEINAEIRNDVPNIRRMCSTLPASISYKAYGQVISALESETDSLGVEVTGMAKEISSKSTSSDVLGYEVPQLSAGAQPGYLGVHRRKGSDLVERGKAPSKSHIKLLDEISHFGLRLNRYGFLKLDDEAEDGLTDEERGNEIDKPATPPKPTPAPATSPKPATKPTKLKLNLGPEPSQPARPLPGQRPSSPEFPKVSPELPKVSPEFPKATPAPSPEGASSQSQQEVQQEMSSNARNGDNAFPAPPKPSGLDKKQHKEASRKFLDGEKALRDGKFELAIRKFTEAIQLDPTEPHYYYRRSEAYLGIGNTIAADEDSDKAVEVAPESAGAWTLIRTCAIVFKALPSTPGAQNEAHIVLGDEEPKGQEEERRAEQERQAEAQRQTQITSLLVLHGLICTGSNDACDFLAARFISSKEEANIKGFYRVRTMMDEKMSDETAIGQGLEDEDPDVFISTAFKKKGSTSSYNPQTAAIIYQLCYLIITQSGFQARQILVTDQQEGQRQREIEEQRRDEQLHQAGKQREAEQRSQEVTIVRAETLECQDAAYQRMNAQPPCVCEHEHLPERLREVSSPELSLNLVFEIIHMDIEHGRTTLCNKHVFFAARCLHIKLPLAEVANLYPSSPGVGGVGELWYLMKGTGGTEEGLFHVVDDPACAHVFFSGWSINGGVGHFRQNAASSRP
ncbi:hypothetical protein IWZ01DRAFT_536917 [Phyllosticta capitalensis]